MLEIIFNQLIMVGLFLVPLILIRAADISLGIAIAKKKSVSFKWKKFLWGIFYSVCFILGVMCFITGIGIVPVLIEYYGIVLNDEVLESLNTISSVSVCIMTVTITVTSYAKDCYAKIKAFITKGEE